MLQRIYGTAWPNRKQLKKHLDMLEEASEVLLCDVIRGIVPVLSIGRQEFAPGPVTAELQAWLEAHRNQQ